MRSRTLRRAAVSCVLLLLLTGCAERWGFGSGDSDGKVHLTYALWDPYQQEGYRKSIDRFEKLHPNIAVTIEQIPYSSYQPKLTSEFISHNGPDLFWVNTPFLGTWIEDEVMTDLTPLIKRDKVDLSQYYPQLVALHQHDGKTYGLPKDWDTIALYYNKDYVAKHHIAIPKKLTWDTHGGGTFVKFLQQLTIDGKGRNATDPKFDASHIATYGITTSNDMQGSYLNYLAMNGAKIFDKPFQKKVVFDSPQGIETFEWLTSLNNSRHVAVPGSELGPNADGSSALQVFARGEAAIYQAGDWNTVSVTQSAKFRMGVLPLPTGPKGRVSVFNGLIDAINADTAHPKEAWELEKWLGSAPSQTIMGEGGYVWPAIKRLDPLFLKAWRKKGIDLQPFLDEANGKVINWPVSPGMNEALTDMGRELGPAYLNGKSVADRVRSAAGAANHDLDRG